MQTKICSYCGKGLLATHGNSSYCPDDVCSSLAQQERQNAVYKIGNDAKLAIQNNYKIFTKLLGKNDNGQFNLHEILEQGFNQDGYFGTGKTGDLKNNSFHVYDYWFQINYGNPLKIQIWKA